MPVLAPSPATGEGALSCLSGPLGQADGRRHAEDRRSDPRLAQVLGRGLAFTPTSSSYTAVSPPQVVVGSAQLLPTRSTPQSTGRGSGTVKRPARSVGGGWQRGP